MATPEGGFRKGNPDARVKIVEYGSFTCSHCRNFHADATRQMLPLFVETGKISFEYRPFVLNGPDLIAAHVAMCDKPERFFVWADAFFDKQEGWLKPFVDLTAADRAAIDKLPPNRQAMAIADRTGLTAFVAERGLPAARLSTCLADPAILAGLQQNQRLAVATHNVEGTPSFLLNGKLLPQVHTWEDLETQIMAALR